MINHRITDIIRALGIIAGICLHNHIQYICEIYKIVPAMDQFVRRKVLIIFIFITMSANQQNWLVLFVQVLFTQDT